jgi:hypothetical protein
MNGRDAANTFRATQPDMRLNVFAAPGAPDDYLHRLHIAATRAFARFGARPDAEIGV